MLENTPGGSKERVEEPGRPHLSLVTHSCTGGGTLLSAVRPAAVKTRDVELNVTCLDVILHSRCKDHA